MLFSEYGEAQSILVQVLKQIVVTVAVATVWRPREGVAMSLCVIAVTMCDCCDLIVAVMWLCDCCVIALTYSTC